MEHCNRKIIVIICSLLCLFFGSIVSYAAVKTHSLTIEFTTEEGPVTSTEFRLYCVLDENDKLSGEFAALSLEIGDLTDSENLNNLADRFVSYMENKAIEPLQTETTNRGGYCKFDDLTNGTYLLIGDSGFIGDITYSPKPVLIRITDYSRESLEVSVKYTMSKSWTVKKVWDDQGNESRPSSVIIQLLRDGEVYDEVTLSVENNWMFTWDALAISNEWSVVEKSVPENYVASVTLDDQTFTVTNKYVSSSETTETTVTTETNTTETMTEHPAEIIPPSDTPSAGDSSAKLPQTGQMWIPVLILFFVGLLLFLIGFLLSNLSDENEKK